MNRSEELKEKEFFGVAALSKAAEEALSVSEIRQTKGIVKQFPNERTIRFYLSEGLLPPAAYSDGTTSVFTYDHLLTILVIKHLQSQGLPIKIIRKVLANFRSRTELEKLLEETVHVSTDPKDARFARESGEQVIAIRDPAEIREILESQVARSSGEHSESEVWERFTITNGVEVSISQASGMHEKERRRFVEEVRKFLS